MSDCGGLSLITTMTMLMLVIMMMMTMLMTMLLMVIVMVIMMFDMIHESLSVDKCRQHAMIWIVDRGLDIRWRYNNETTTLVEVWGEVVRAR